MRKAVTSCVAAESAISPTPLCTLTLRPSMRVGSLKAHSRVAHSNVINLGFRRKPYVHSTPCYIART